MILIQEYPSHEKRNTFQVRQRRDDARKLIANGKTRLKQRKRKSMPEGKYWTIAFRLLRQNLLRHRTIIIQAKLPFCLF